MTNSKLAVRVGVLLASGIGLLAGCTTVTDPVQVGPDTYMIGLGSRGGFSSDAELMAKSIKAAGAFCASKGKQIDVQNTTQHGVQMWTPQSNQVTFKCLKRDVTRGGAANSVL